MEIMSIRKSSRCSQSKLKQEKQQNIRDSIHHETNEKLLDVFVDVMKGRGVRAVQPFMRNDFVIEYKGDMLDYMRAKQRESEYAKNNSIGCFMFFYNYKNKKWCVDATPETGYKGRLINHSYLRPNLNVKVIECDGCQHLVFLANRTIAAGEELLFDYGDRSSQAIMSNPWLLARWLKSNS